ncbi:MAG: hypothetical protein R3Y56_06025 [Akkermansia sp.]
MTLTFDPSAIKSAISSAVSSWSCSFTISGSDFWKPSGGSSSNDYDFNCTLSSN